MSYGVRNTIILFVALLLIAGGGFAYIHFYQEALIQELEESLSELEQVYEEKLIIADRYPAALESFERSEEFIETFDKTLFQTSDPDAVFKYLSELNAWQPSVEFNFIYNSQTTEDQYGIIRSSISGTGEYRALYNFLNRIENSMPIQKVEELNVNPVLRAGEYGMVNFTFVLNSYYDRSDFFSTSEEDLEVVLRAPEQFHAPLFPLIRDPDPNVDNLTDVENSRLIGISSSRVFLRDQTGQIVTLGNSDPVYLGILESIDVQQGRASFRLNKGGIIEVVTLEVQR